MDRLLAWTEEDKRDVLRDEAAEIADAETGSAPGVEGMDTAQQISRLPPGQKGLKRKSELLEAAVESSTTTAPAIYVSI